MWTGGINMVIQKASLSDKSQSIQQVFNSQGARRSMYKESVEAPSNREVSIPMEAPYRTMDIPPVITPGNHITTPGPENRSRPFSPEKQDLNIKALYHQDDHLDYYQLTDGAVKRNADAAMVVTPKKGLHDIGGGKFQLEVKPFKSMYLLGPQVPYEQQPVLARTHCSALWIGSNKILSAYHFFKANPLDTLRFVRHYEMVSPREAVTIIPAENVFRGVKILHGKYDTYGEQATGSDWVIIELDRAVEGMPPPRISTKPVQREQRAYILGYKQGLPLKYAAGPVIRNEKKSFFAASINATYGNSGSGVYDMLTHELLGIVVRSKEWSGQTEAASVPGIYPHPKFPFCETEITRVTEFMEFIYSKNQNGRM